MLAGNSGCILGQQYQDDEKDSAKVFLNRELKTGSCSQSSSPITVAVTVIENPVDADWIGTWSGRTLNHQTTNTGKSSY